MVFKKKDSEAIGCDNWIFLGSDIKNTLKQKIKYD